MEVYVLDEWLRRIEVIDQFESCTWTDRFALKGDIELVVEGNQHYRSTLVEGTMLACNESDRIMQIETVERTQDDNDRKLIKVKGNSAEGFVLENRIVLKMLSGLGDKPNWAFKATPSWIMWNLFKMICVDGKLSQYDKMPFYVPGNMYPPDTIAEYSQPIMYETPPGPLYDTLVDLAASYDLGFRIVRNQDWSELRFNVYAGNDRTTNQTYYPAVVFSSSLDNLTGINEFDSSAGYKNHAIVTHKDAAAVQVYAEGIPTDISGFAKRSIHIDGSSLDSELTGVELTNAMRDLGRTELGKLRRLGGYDGEVSEYGHYKPGVDYILGDLVEIQSDTGANSIMRVSELIYASDAQGDRAYPTLSIYKYYSPGAWSTWDYGQTWSEAVPTWAEA